MLFILAYNLIITIIDPDSKNGVGSAAKLIQNIIISFALIIVLPVGFNWLHTFQMNIIEEDLIGSLETLTSAEGGMEISEATCELMKQMNILSRRIMNGKG